MAQRYLAVDWEQNQLHVVSASVSGGKVVFHRAFAVETPISPGVGSAEELGKIFREQLKIHDVTPAPVLACLARDRIIVKEVRYPAVPAHEEREVVRFQAIKELTEAADDVHMDYLPMAGPSADGQRRAIVLIVRKELVQIYRGFCQSAGVRLSGLMPRAFGMATCLRQLITSGVLAQPEPADAPLALVTVGERWAEFCILRGGTVLQARPMALGAGLFGEIRRNLAVHAGQTPNSAIAGVFLALSGEHAALRERLTESLDVPVHPIDPFAGADSKELPTSGRGTFIGAIGLIQQMAQQHELLVNFNRVRQVQAPKNPNQRAYVLAAILLLLTIGGGIAWGLAEVARKSKEVAEKTQDRNDLQRQLKQLREEKKLLLALYKRDTPVWADEMVQLSKSVKDADNNFRLKEIKADPAKRDVVTTTGAAAAARREPTRPAEEILKPSGQLTIKALASNSQRLDALRQEYKKAGNVEEIKGANELVKAFPAYEPQAAQKDPKLARTYSQVINVRRRAPEQFLGKPGKE